MNIYKKVLLAFFPSVPLYFLGVYIVTSDPVHIFWFLAYFYFILALCISPLAYILTKNTYLKKAGIILIQLRRQIWIITALFAFAHVMNFYEWVLWVYEKFFASSQTFLEFVFYAISGSQWNIFWMSKISFWFWTIGMIIMFFLLITSNNYAQNLLWAKNWKRLQSFTYPLFLIIVVHIYFVWWWKGAYLYPAICLILMRLYVWFDKNYKKKWKMSRSLNWYRKFYCPPCWYIYDEKLWDIDWGLSPWTKYEDIPEDWVCPVCWAAKKDFILLDGSSQDTNLTTFEWKIHKKVFLTNNVIELQVMTTQKFHILPWQFCNIVINDTTKRSYSIASYKDNILSFLIKLKEWWKGWEYLKNITVWENISLEWPYGNFVLHNTSNKKVFIATWTWLSPIYNMMLHSWKEEKELYLWVQKASDLFYLDQLQAIPCLTTHIFLSKEETESYHSWRIDIWKIIVWKHDEVYICWNPLLVEECRESLIQRKHQSIYVEKFL